MFQVNTTNITIIKMNKVSNIKIMYGKIFQIYLQVGARRTKNLNIKMLAVTSCKVPFNKKKIGFNITLVFYL